MNIQTPITTDLAEAAAASLMGELLPQIIIDESGSENVFFDTLGGIRIPLGVGNVSVFALNAILGPVILEPFSDGFEGEFERDVASLEATDSWDLRAEFEGSLGDFFGRLLNDADVEVEHTLGGASVSQSRNVSIEAGALDGPAEFEGVSGLSFEIDEALFSDVEADEVADADFEFGYVFSSDTHIADSANVRVTIEETVFSELDIQDTDGVLVVIEETFESRLDFDDVRDVGVTFNTGDADASFDDVDSLVFRSADGDDRLNIFGGEEIAANTGGGTDRIRLNDLEQAVINASDGDDDIRGSGELNDVVLQGGNGADHFGLSGWIEGDIALDFKPREDTGEVGFEKFDVALELLYAAADREDASGFVRLDEERSIQFTRFDEVEAVESFVFADDAMGGGGKG